MGLLFGTHFYLTVGLPHLAVLGADAITFCEKRDIFGHHLYGDDICFANVFRIDSVNISERIFMRL